MALKASAEYSVLRGAVAGCDVLQRPAGCSHCQQCSAALCTLYTGVRHGQELAVSTVGWWVLEHEGRPKAPCGARVWQQRTRPRRRSSGC